jgi:hypothetical protein
MALIVQNCSSMLFSNTPEGATASSILYSLVETAKENNLHPYHYLKYLLEELPNRAANDIESLLPWSESLPDCCHVPIKMS